MLTFHRMIHRLKDTIQPQLSINCTAITKCTITGSWLVHSSDTIDAYLQQKWPGKTTATTDLRSTSCKQDRGQ